jgi:hypothetical protein
VIVIAAVVLVTGLGRARPSPAAPSLVTTFQPGEIQKVPSACSSVPAATLSIYLPGKPAVASPPGLDGWLDSQCDWTLDKRPVYRLLELDIRAYAPDGLASGNGSATSAATDAYAAAMRGKQHPARATHAPAAQVSTVPRLGSAAFTATQVYRVGGAVTDVVTTVVRYRNVLITVTLDGLDHSSRGGYGPVSMGQLSGGSLAVARAALARVR